MKKTLIIEKRKKAKQLREQGWSIRKIARYLVAGKDNVMKWLKMTEGEIERDNRGWPAGKMRKHSEEEKKRLLEILGQLKDEDKYQPVPGIVRKLYFEKFQKDIPDWFVRTVVRGYYETIAASATGPAESKIKCGGFPLHGWKKLGKVVMKVRFFQMEPVKGAACCADFISCRYIQPFKLGFIYGVAGQTSCEVIRVLKKIWKHHALPDLVLMNYTPAFGANLSQPRYIGKVPLFLLNLGIKPFYSSMERGVGQRSDRQGDQVFSAAFWNTLSSDDKYGKSLKIERFFLKYSSDPHSLSAGEWEAGSVPEIVLKYWDIDNRNIDQFGESRIYFLRVVQKIEEPEEEPGTGYVDILGVSVELAPELIGFRVLCKLNLKSETLTVFFHNQDGRDVLKIARKVPFEVANVN